MITIAGSINLDLIARVGHLPGPGETVSGVGYAEAPGGKGANQALAARRAGHDVAMIGCVGQDANATAALALLDAADVDLTAVARRPDVPTGVALILVDDTTGENMIAVVPGANAKVLDGTGRPHFAPAMPVLMPMEIPDAALRTVLETARETGAGAWLNIAPYRASAVELAPRADVVIANQTEFAALAADLDVAEAALDDRLAAVRATTGGVIVLTLGADGALAATDEGIARASSPAIEPVDTVGAGDTFCGYLAAGRAEGLDWPDALDLACRAGALACMTRGAQPSIPERDAVDQFTASPDAR